MWLYIRKRYIFLFLIVAAVGSFWWYESKEDGIDTQESQAKLGAPLFNYFGNFHRPIGTKSPLAQRYFNQGLVLFYGFNFAESVRSFQEAAHIDPQCPMCYWGLALALGSKSNTPLNGNERRDAAKAIQTAKNLSAKSPPADRALIDALALRHQAKYNAKSPPITKVMHCLSCRSLPIVTSEELKDYADAMKTVAEQFPNDIDAKNLYVAAVFDAADWKLYDENKEPLPETLEIISTLESAFQIDQKHIPTHHFYVLAMAQSKTPEKALSSADYLRNAMLGMRQFTHMPAHIYIQTGRYHDATVASQRAIMAFKDYVGESWGQGFEPMKNYLFQYDLNYLWTTATLQGRSRLAIDTADELALQTSPTLAKDNRFLFYYAAPYLSRVRFGRWYELLEMSQPSSELPFQNAMWHYSRGIAFTHLGRLDEAQEELYKLDKISQRHRVVASIGKVGQAQLKIAIAILNASIAAKRGQHEEMIAYWKSAIDVHDEFKGNDPSIWYFPLREGFADALLSIKLSREAETEYLAALKQYPENGWSLYGLAQSLRTQGRMQEAEKVLDRFNKAWTRADVTLPVY